MAGIGPEMDVGFGSHLKGEVRPRSDLGVVKPCTLLRLAVQAEALNVNVLWTAPRDLNFQALAPCQRDGSLLYQG